jgi:hypothetical protein
MVCLIAGGCGLGNMVLRHKGTDILDKNSTQANESNSTVTYRVQIGIFDSRADADNLAESARSKTDYPVYVEYITPFYRVRVGDFIRKSDAEECVIFLRQKGFSDSRYVFSNINSQ